MEYPRGWCCVRKHLDKEEIEKYLDGSWHLQIVTYISHSSGSKDCELVQHFDRKLQWRYSDKVLVKIWRPINVVINVLLALCDLGSLAQKWLAGGIKSQPGLHLGDILSEIKPAARYYYFSYQKPEELLLFMDSESEVEQKGNVVQISSNFTNMASAVLYHMVLSSAGRQIYH